MAEDLNARPVMVQSAYSDPEKGNHDYGNYDDYDDYDDYDEHKPLVPNTQATALKYNPDFEADDNDEDIDYFRKSKYQRIICWHPCCVRNKKQSRAMLKFTESFCDWEVRRRNEICFVLGLLGIVMTVVELELAWDGKTLTDSPLTNLLKACISGLTLILLWELYGAYRLQLQILLARFTQDGKASRMGLWAMPQLFWPFLAECVVCSVHALPFVWNNTNPVLNDKIGLLTFLRLYLAVRVIRDHTQVYQKRVEIKKSGFKTGTPPNFDTNLALKAFYHEHKIVAQTLMFAISVLVLSYCIYVCEREKQAEFNDLGTAAWFTGVTMTTVGYGDVTPKSLSGRVMSMVTAIVGMILSSLLTAVITNQVALKHHQIYAAHWVRKDKIERKQEDTAARFIQNEYRKFKVRRQLDSETKFLRRVYLKTKQLGGGFAARRIYYSTTLRSLRNELQIEADNSDNPVFDSIMKLEGKIHTLETGQKKMQAMLDNLESLKTSHNIIIQRLDMILNK